MKRIFHVITTINRGGAENQLVVLVKEQIRQGLEVHVVYLKGEPELRSQFITEGAIVHSELAGFNPLLQPLKLAQIKGLRDSVVHSHLPRAELVAFLTPRKFTYIITRHNAEAFFPGAPRFFSSMLSILVSSRAKKIIAISHAVSNFLLEKKELTNARKLIVIHYGYRSHLNVNERLQNTNIDICKLGTIARLTSQKDIPTMFSTLKLLKEELPDATLSVVGAGSLELSLKEYAHKLELDEDINFLGRTDRTLEFLRSIDVFILTSKYEGFGLVLLEAMDAGVPIVAARNSAIPEVLGANFPGLCETGNPMDFAAKIMKLKDAEFRKVVLQIQEERLNLFDDRTMTKLISDVYFE